MNTCRSCGARITWLKTAAGKSIPVDEDPAPDGNIVVDEGIARVLGREEMAQVKRTANELYFEPRYRSHFATCPQAREWRRSGLGKT